jgi:hypothetical protein
MQRLRKPYGVCGLTLGATVFVLLAGASAWAKGPAQGSTPVDQQSAERLAIAESVIARVEAASERQLDPSFRAKARERLAALPMEALLQAQAGEGGLGLNTLGDSQATLVYTPVYPCRIIDTRVGGGLIPAGVTRSFLVAAPDYSTQGGSATGCNVPFGPATAVMINFAAVSPQGGGNLRVTPSNLPIPTAAIINYTKGVTIANGLVVAICDPSGPSNCHGGDIVVRADVSATHLVADVLGYFQKTPDLRVDTDGENTMLGDGALASNQTGTQDVAIGGGALQANQTGSANSAVGVGALNSNTEGDANSAFGFHAAQYNQTGSSNSAFGNEAGQNNQTGSGNSAFGAWALQSNYAGTYNSAFGTNALGASYSSYNSAFGAFSAYNNQGSNNNAFGYGAQYNNEGSSNNSFGNYAHASNQGSNNNAFGNGAMYYNTGGNNNGFGYAALSNNTGGTNNGFGYYALYNNTGGTNNGFGYAALYNNTGGVNNGFGYAVLYNNQGSYNNAFGYSALYNAQGWYNNAFGYQALYLNTTGASNVAIGYRAGYNVSTGSNNIHISAPGSSSDDATIRIGTNQVASYIAGIYSRSVDGSTGVPVYVDSDGKLGTVSPPSAPPLPTCSFATGGGTSPSCALDTGSGDGAGIINATTGSGAPGSAGTITLTFNASLGTNAPSCVVAAMDSVGSWDTGVTTRITAASTSAFTVGWQNGSTALSPSTRYRVAYQCVGK